MSTREQFEKWVTTVWRPDDGAELLKREWPRFAFAAWQAARATALEEAAKECDEMAEAWNRMAQGASDGRYDFKCDAGDECADAIRALARGEPSCS